MTANLIRAHHHAPWCRDELTINIETTNDLVGCAECGTRAEAQDRMAVELRDLACFGRPTRLVWNKRRWRCIQRDCATKTWTETSVHVSSRALLTRRAGAEACRQVGENARPVALAEELGVCWWTVMATVIEHGTPLVEDPDRVGPVDQLGVDETSWLRANRRHATLYATGLVHLDERILIDMVEGNSADDLRRWCARQDPAWLGGITTVATDLAESYRAGLDSAHLSHATRVADPFHVVRVGNRCIDKVRRRVQNETLGHRGRKHDPLYRIRKLLLTGSERLDARGSERMLLGLRVGDRQDEVLGAWLAKESVRDLYLTDDLDTAEVLIDKAIAGCAADEVEETRSLDQTLASWRAEILEHHRTGASNGPTESTNLCVKKVKRCGHGFRRFEHYRLRVLLHAGGVSWPKRPSPPRIRTRTPHSVA